MDIAEYKERQAEAWGRGHYRSLSRVLAPAARDLCDACAVSAGQEVLDVAAGDGNFALVCAGEGASVVASDLAPAMVEAGRARTDAEGYDVEWVQADAEELPFGDDSFECVGSVFGAVFAPQPDVMARELFRVVRPGGTVGLTAWIQAASPPSCSVYAGATCPRPPSCRSRKLWGDEETVRERLDGLAARMETELLAIVWEAESPEEFVDWLERDAPMQVAARESLSEEQLKASHADHIELVRRHAGGDGARADRGLVPPDRGAQARLALTARLLLEYDGSEFAGWARQPGLRTVEGVLAEVLETATRQSLALMVAGRTDSGVHARGQVASHEGAAVAAERLNGLLPDDVSVLRSEPAADGFDARRDARSRTYRYRVLARSEPSALDRGRALWWPRPLDREAVDACAAALPGTHDFTAFTPTQTDHVRFERHVTRAEWVEEPGDVLAFWIEADTFMRHMVRILMGTMLAVASGRGTPAEFRRLLEGRPRSEAAETAPAHGLCLESVRY